MMGWRLAFAATASFVLDSSATTSAAIFNSEDRLVRTLWSGRRFPPGAVNITWDTLDDKGTAVDGKEAFVARLLVHNIKYVWEGVIGNTSAELTGAHIHRALFPISGMAIDRAGNAFFAVGYNELHSSMHRFSVTEPQRPSEIGHGDFRREFEHVATDGERVYFANIGHSLRRGSVRDPTFVVALNASDGTEYRFQAGTLEAPADSAVSLWESVIDSSPGSSQWEGRSPEAATGLAVQRTGKQLFVAHGGRNEVRVFDKVDGRRLGTIPVDSPRAIATGPDDSLWVICRVEGQWVAAHYEVQGGSWQRTSYIRAVSQDPVAIGVSPNDATVLIADAGTEQLRAFSSTGATRWTLGAAGGYRSGNPNVSNDRFWLSGGPTYVAYQADGSFWVGDPGNLRNLHFSSSRRYLGQIAYLPETYTSTVDPNDIQRVFVGFLEFKVDYRKPIQQSWTLARNWGGAVGVDYAGSWNDPDGRTFAGLRSVVTFPAGRTFAVARRLDAPSSSDLFELAKDGIRRAGRLELGTRLYADGSQRDALERFGALHLYERRFVGTDASGNPSWQAPQEVAAVPRLEAVDPFYHDVPLVIGVNDATYPDTASGVFVSFVPGYSSGYHLGGLRRGVSGWLWRASASGEWTIDGRGNPLSGGGTYDTGHAVRYPGSVAVTLGEHIIYGYHGEGWNNGEANQWLHFFDNGMFIGQFGTPQYPATTKDDAPAGSAGNSFCPQFVRWGDQAYLWHNDENVHSGLHRWHIEGLQDLRVLTAPIRF